MTSISFQNTEHLFKAIQDAVFAQEDALIVNNVSQEDFVEINNAREEAGRKFRFRQFIPETHQLIITVPTGAHENLHLTLYRLTTNSIHEMGLSRRWRDIGGTSLPKSFPYGSCGEGDSCGGLEPERMGEHRWPTLVIESGYSQTLNSLRAKMRWWFGTSNHDVKIAVLVKMDLTRGTILLEKMGRRVSHLSNRD